MFLRKRFFVNLFPRHCNRLCKIGKEFSFGFFDIFDFRDSFRDDCFFSVLIYYSKIIEVCEFYTRIKTKQF